MQPVHIHALVAYVLLVCTSCMYWLYGLVVFTSYMYQHQKCPECSKQRRTALKSQIDAEKPRNRTRTGNVAEDRSISNCVREWRRVACELREAQTERLKSILAEKSH